MTDLRQPDYDSLDPEARALINRWSAELAGQPPETAMMFRFLVSMAAVRVGELREVSREMRNGRPVVILLDPYRETFYAIHDPELGEHEDAAVAEMVRMLGGG